ncbi:hypothetical protein Areg01_78880 [Actinoplanes regularis]|nr:hypothetical protein Areg01_78880 [Actinoplanes regularis]
MSGPATEEEVDVVETFRLSDLAQDIVEAIAPDEAMLLPEVSAAWFDGDLELGDDSSLRWRGGTIGAGLTPDLVVYIVYPLVAGALANAVVPAAQSGWKRLRARRRRHENVVISAEDLRRAEEIRDLVLARAAAARIAESRARPLADAAYAALIRRRPPEE